MPDNQLLQTIRALNTRERSALSDFASCALFNRRPEVSRLCRHLVQHIGRSSSASLSLERQFEAAFPGETYDNARLRHSMSYLLEVARQYLAYSDWAADPLAQNRNLCRAARKRGLDRIFDKTWEIATAELEKSPVRDARHHYLRYQILQEQLEQESRGARSTKINLQLFPETLTQYYAAEMLRHACVALSHQATSGQSYEFDLLESMTREKSWKILLQTPVVAVYHQLYKSLQPDGEAHFGTLKILLAAHGNCFSVEELRGLHLQAINVCIRRMNSGQRAYIREAFDLYKSALALNVLAEEGVLSGFTYKNIIRIAAALSEHEWAEQFAEQYREMLHARERDNFYRYNRAFLHFQKQDYARAMPLLRQVELEDTLNNLDARRMLLRSYYELGEWDALESLLQSFGAYLRRQKNLGYHRTTNENLLVFTKKLLGANLKDKRIRSSIQQEIERTTDVAERAWLLKVLGGEE
ncbi:MAG: hypothetical protein Q7T20_09915 [Saprospiraceae bacterium]|nr:hypothetical protein [Saprospiraceae bacterium]